MNLIRLAHLLPALLIASILCHLEVETGAVIVLVLTNLHKEARVLILHREVVAVVLHLVDLLPVAVAAVPVVAVAEVVTVAEVVVAVDKQ